MLSTVKRESAICEWLWQVKWVAWNNERDVNLHSGISGTIKCTTGSLVLIVCYFTQYEAYLNSKFHFTAKYIMLTTQSIKCLYVLPFFIFISYWHTTYNFLQTLKKFLSVACFDTGKLLYSEQLFIDAVFIDILMDGGFFRVSLTTQR
jgi:hypothetical protein